MPDILTRLIRRKRKFIALLAVLLVVGVGPYLYSRVRSADRQLQVHSRSADRFFGEEEITVIRVATFNIAHGRGTTDQNWNEGGQSKRARVRHIANLIREMQADVVVLNEVDFDSTWSGHQNQAAAIAEAAGFAWRVEQRNLDFRFLYGSWKFGNAILSKFPIKEARVIEFARFRAWENWLAGCKRGVVCTIQPTRDKRIRLLAVHLEHRCENTRVESARIIERLVKSDQTPLIVAGDFNSTPRHLPNSDADHANENAMELLVTSDRFHMYRASPATAEMTYSSTRPTRTIDWILIPRSFEFLDYHVVDTDLSDHRPVVATIQCNDF